MPLEISITYNAENTYENWVEDAHWQFLIIPEINDTQKITSLEFKNSIQAINEYSVNGYGFKTIRIHPKKKFKKVVFEATFQLLKEANTFLDHIPTKHVLNAYQEIQELDFKVTFDSFLQKTHYTTIPAKFEDLFVFDTSISIFENLNALNEWTFLHLYFKTDVTDVNTTLDQILEHNSGVCQDFTHLFCALARENGIPARYVSGYLNQGNGYFGDSQMHAWAEVYISNMGWVGFDPTNRLIANTNHIKIAHGKDYHDCSPLKGIVYTTGRNQTKHSVKVSSQQQQQ